MFLLHTVSALASQLTTVLGLTLQLYGRLLLSQNSVPLHKLPSSWLAQSLSWLQPQVLVPDLHTPPAQASPVVQPLPSSQGAVLPVWVQPALGSQASVVQGLLSVQNTPTLMAEPAHLPRPHVSLLVQALPSSQGRVLAALTQPVLGSHASLVHGLLSSQLAAVPLQTPALHTSDTEHALPSLHGLLLAT